MDWCILLRYALMFLFGTGAGSFLSACFIRSKNQSFQARFMWHDLFLGVGVGIAWLLSCRQFGFRLQAGLACGTVLLLLFVAVIDMKTMEIPNTLVLLLCLPAIAAIFLFPEISLLQRGIGLVCVSLPMLLLTLAIPGAFGGGDVKLIAVCGFLLGWQKTLLATFIALLLGGGYAIVQMLRGKIKRKQHIAFGQYICTGVFLSLLYGEALINVYLDVFWKR